MLSRTAGRSAARKDVYDHPRYWFPDGCRDLSSLIVQSPHWVFSRTPPSLLLVGVSRASPSTLYGRVGWRFDSNSNRTDREDDQVQTQGRLISDQTINDVSFLS